jgi:hypothetical protein
VGKRSRRPTTTPSPARGAPSLDRSTLTTTR